MSSFNVTVFFLVCLVCIAFVAAEDISAENSISKVQDLDTSATSAKLFNLGSLFGQYPNYGYGYGSNSYNPNTGYRPTGTYRPSYYYPTTGSGGYYPSSGGYYPSTGWTGSQYPSYYSNTGSGYYPNTGTNILGSSGGYGGYGSGYGYGGGYNDYNRYGGYNDYNRYGGASGYGGYGAVIC